MKYTLKILFFLIFVSQTQLSMASLSALPEQREAFFAMEKLIKKGKNQQFFQQIKSLRDYPLYPYLQYQWLVKHLDQTKKIKAFLKDYADTRYSKLLNSRWQNYLVKHNKWQLFVDYYTESNSKKKQCLYHWAKYRTGAKKEALKSAKKLWVIGKSLPSECDSIFKVLMASPHFTEEMLWTRFDAALMNKKVGLASYVKRFMSKKNRRIAALWLKLHSNPLLIKDEKILKQGGAQAGLIFAHGIDRLARKDLNKALEIWEARKNNFNIASSKKQYLEQRLAMTLAYRQDERAYMRLRKLENPDNSTKEWRVRVALKSQNWEQVVESIDILSKEVQQEEKWQYWLARALEKTEKPMIADRIFSKLSKERSYFGYLSANKLDKKIELADRPIQITPIILEEFKQKTDFRVVAELIAVDKLWEAKRQWWYAIKKLDNDEKLMAAKYAQQLKWTQEAIFTIAKAKYWDDVSLRFPLLYEKQVANNADKQKLDSAVIYGLIRQESAFNQNAQSRVGASGLMQIMPKTGRQIARELKEKWRSKSSLLDPETNIKYGAYYYKKMLNKFKGHYALAAAAYNAGPHRVKRWMPADNSLAADIWIETIPFKETRRYVSAVLTYSLIYQKQMNRDNLTMGDFMKDVIPG